MKENKDIRSMPPGREWWYRFLIHLLSKSSAAAAEIGVSHTFYKDLSIFVNHRVEWNERSFFTCETKNETHPYIF